MWSSFLTEGNICSQGSPTINVVMGDGIDEQLSAELFTLSIDSLCWNQYWPLILENDETGSNDQQSFECQMTSTCPTPSPWFEKLWNRRLDLNRKSGSMGSSTSKAHETSTSSSLLDPMAPKQTKEEKELYLDFERTVTADLRDPRAKSHQWPCMGNHNKAKPQSNKWGQWTNCAVCGLRMEYIPKKGAPASETHQPNPAMVLRALKELQQLLPGGALPEEALVRVVIDKVVAEERMTTLLEEYQRQLETAKKKVIKGQQAMMTAGRGQPSSGVPSGYRPEMPTSPPRSTTSWEQVTPQQSPPRRTADEIMELLTQEERNQLMQRVQHRAAQDTAVPVSEAEMEPDYNQNLALNWTWTMWRTPRNVHPLPLRVGQAMVNTMHYIHDEFNDVLAETVYGDKPVVWEVFCSPDSELSHQCSLNVVIGYVGGHVDDFNRSGDLSNPAWLEVRKQIDAAYKWGSMKQQCFRHTGIDLEVMEKNNERWIQLSQDFYADSLQDLAISAERLRQDPKDPLSPGEVAACRAALGALQWLATQTQVHICARVNLLLTELTVTKTLQTAKEIQSLIKEVRQDPVTLRLWHLPEVTHWQDMTVVTLADQAHANRPQGGSTGRLPGRCLVDLKLPKVKLDD